MSAADFHSLCSQWTGAIYNNIAHEQSGGGLFTVLDSTTANTSLMGVTCPGLEFSNNAISSTNQYAENRGTSPYKIVVQEQPSNTTTPGSTQTMSIVFSVLDMFGQKCTSVNGTQMKLETKPHMLYAGSITPTVGYGQVAIGTNSSKNQFGVRQAYIGEAFHVQAFGTDSDPMGLPSWVLRATTDEVKVADCLAGFQHCSCDDPGGCNSGVNACPYGAWRGDFVCNLRSETQSHSLSLVVKIGIALGSLAGVLAVVALIYQVRKRRSTELAFSYAKTPVARLGNILLELQGILQQVCVPSDCTDNEAPLGLLGELFAKCEGSVGKSVETSSNIAWRKTVEGHTHRKPRWSNLNDNSTKLECLVCRICGENPESQGLTKKQMRKGSKICIVKGAMIAGEGSLQLACLLGVSCCCLTTTHTVGHLSAVVLIHQLNSFVMLVLTEHWHAHRQESRPCTDR